MDTVYLRPGHLADQTVVTPPSSRGDIPDLSHAHFRGPLADAEHIPTLYLSPPVAEKQQSDQDIWQGGEDEDDGLLDMDDFFAFGIAGEISHDDTPLAGDELDIMLFDDDLLEGPVVDDQADAVSQDDVDDDDGDMLARLMQRAQGFQDDHTAPQPVTEEDPFYMTDFDLDLDLFDGYDMLDFDASATGAMLLSGRRYACLSAYSHDKYNWAKRSKLIYDTANKHFASSNLFRFNF